MDGETHLLSAVPQTALHDVAHAELSTDRARFGLPPFVGLSRAVSDHEGAGRAGEVGGEILGELLGEIILVRVAALICERQDDERQPRSRRHARCFPPLGSDEVRPGHSQPCGGSQNGGRPEGWPKGCADAACMDGARWLSIRWGHGIHAQGPGDVLQALRTEIDEADIGKAAHLKIGRLGEP
ncbi:hypothetical protein [Methylobacterium mesophilicum]|uniref:hypothetical protein n=1 Tax=Methylobacterium mesophilicum TaxID=39956 RepID=UPI001EE3877E|nr:hypothetical protein [Methylobacterium mesophilicum]